MTKIDRYRYEIDENNAVRIWDDENPNENDAPFLYQPDLPDGTPWSSAEEADAWAKEFINSLLNPPAVPESSSAPIQNNN